MVWAYTVDEAVEVLLKNKETELWVKVHGGIRKLSVLRIAEALATNTALKSLNLRGNAIADVSLIGEALKTNHSLSHFYLSDNNIVDVENLAPHLHRLKVLHLDGNSIVDITAIGKALLSKFCILSSLILDHNQIQDIDSIGLALKSNKSLEALYLKSNQISNIKVLSSGIEKNSTLQELSLRNNNVKDATDLIAALKRNHNLRYLSLDQNPLMAPELVWKFEHKLMRRPSVLGVCVCLQDYRARKRDYRALASVIGIGKSAKGGSWIFDELVMSNVAQFLWNSEVVANEIESTVRELFGQSEKDARDILDWMKEDLS
jgi:hypothetical protein